MKKFARKCDCCGKVMNKGYHDSRSVYCSDRCLIWGNSDDGIQTSEAKFQYDMDAWELDHKKYPDDCYYTEWEEIDEDKWFDEEGNSYSHCQKCNNTTMDLMSYCNECLTHK